MIHQKVTQNCLKFLARSGPIKNAPTHTHLLTFQDTVIIYSKILHRHGGEWVCGCMSACVYVCVCCYCISECVYVCVCVCLCVCVCVCVCVCMRAWVCLCESISTLTLKKSLLPPLPALSPRNHYTYVKHFQNSCWVNQLFFFVPCLHMHVWGWIKLKTAHVE